VIGNSEMGLQYEPKENRASRRIERQGTLKSRREIQVFQVPIFVPLLKKMCKNAVTVVIYGTSCFVLA
jgi:hypothetical protein